MTSRNKFKKARNSYNGDALKMDYNNRMKRITFYDARSRKQYKKIAKEEVYNCDKY